MYLKMVGCLGIVAATSGYGYSRGMEYQRQITDTGELQRVIRQLAEKWSILMHHSPRYALLFPEDAVRTTGSGWNIWQKNWRCRQEVLQ